MADRAINQGVNLPAGGNFARPPADAPQEVTVEGSERPTAEQVATARRNELDAPTFAPKPMTVEQMASYLGKSVDEIVAMQASGSGRRDTAAREDGQVRTAEPLPPVSAPASTIILTDAPITSLRRVSKPRPIIEGVGGVEQEPAPTIGADSALNHAAAADGPADVIPSTAGDEPASVQAPVELSPILPHQRAGSHTDSPSRGVPQPIADRGKQITGGFGDVGEAQYFPLTGIELRLVIEDLLAQLHARIQDDLRFSMASTYPRVSAEVAITITGYAMDNSMQIVKRMRPHERTPIDVARAHADEICFIITAEHVEMTDSGESITPPDQVRHELGVEIPRKRAVKLPGNQGSLIVDLK